jgi:hypothetical protein
VSRTLIPPLLVPQCCRRSCWAAGVAVFVHICEPALADGLDWASPQVSAPLPPAPTVAVSSPSNLDDASNFFSTWAAVAKQARATQPTWSSPLVTTTGLLEQRLRFDLSGQHAGTGADTTVVDGGKGLDLIVSDSNEIQIAAPAYDIRTTPSGKGEFSGFADWAFLRVEQRLASSPESGGNYVVTAWLQVQAPTGIAPLTSSAWTYLPTMAFGKGWGDFDIQATVGGVLPASHVSTLGDQIQTNVAFQYHLLNVLWPQMEVNWTYYADGQRGGINQVFLTPGLVIGRFRLADHLLFTFGAGYQFAVTPDFRPNPLTPAYNHAWLLTSRFNF